MNFVFENLETEQNFIECNDVNGSGIRRFTTSPIVSSIIRLMQGRIKVYSATESFKNSSNHSLEKYIIATGVTHSPYDWCHSSRSNLFSFLNDDYLRDLRQEKAFLLLDQSHEGYHEEWVFDELHNSCITYQIKPNRLIYITGNLEEKRQYERWCNQFNITDKMAIIPTAHFESVINETVLNRVRIYNLQPLPNFNDHLQYKIEHLDKITTYNCLQKRPRAHRFWMFKELVDNGLLDKGICSMNFLEYDRTYYMGKIMSKDEYDKISKLLPLLPPTNESRDQEIKDFSDQDSGKYQLRFNEDLMLDTWVSVISEASFGEDTCFISEKTFKPIAACHPFIIIGNKYSLRNLRELGYKTFHPFIDETYDELETWERYSAITNAIKKIADMPNNEKIEWLKGMQDILEHNLNTLSKNSNNHIFKIFIDINKNYKGT